MSKFNVGDKVRIKGDLSKCEFGYSYYMERFAGKKATVINTFGKGGIKLDIDKQVWNWSENVLELIEENDNMNTKIEKGNKVNESDLKDSEISKEVEEKKEVENDNVKMKRIDYILNAKDNMQAILDETELDCDICPVAGKVCNGNCEFHYKKYLNEEIEVDKSKLKDSDVESITIGQALQSIYDIPPQIKINSDKIKEVNVDNENDPVNQFMEEYEKIVTETMELCIKKNKDYGSSVQDTYERFGDVSYLVRITDKYNRICSLLDKKAEVKDESIDDTIRDMANYCFLWLASRNVNK